MKTKLKVKLALVLSTSILINIFLIWEVFRLRNENNKIYKAETGNSQSLEDFWNTNQPVEEQPE